MSKNHKKSGFFDGGSDQKIDVFEGVFFSNRPRHVGGSRNPEKSIFELGSFLGVKSRAEHDALSFRSIRGRESVQKSILVSLFAFFDHFPHIFGILGDHSYPKPLTFGGF